MVRRTSERIGFNKWVARTRTSTILPLLIAKLNESIEILKSIQLDGVKEPTVSVPTCRLCLLLAALVISPLLKFLFLNAHNYEVIQDFWCPIVSHCEHSAGIVQPFKSPLCT